MARRGWLRAALCALLALSVGFGCEAETVYTGFFDIYYHAAPNCALANGAMGPIGLESAARDKGLSPCPVCVADGTDYPGVEAVVRAGTVVVRVPDEWLALADEAIGFTAGERFTPYWSADETGPAARRALAELLHGEAYVNFLKSAEDGARQADFARPEVRLSDVESLLMNVRHIGAAWLFTLRPGEAVRAAMADDGRLTVGLSALKGTLRLDGDHLNAACNRRLDTDLTLSLNETRNSVAFEGDYGGINLAVYAERDANICVVHERAPVVGRMDGVELRLDGMNCGIALNGYHSDSGVTYCCALTQGELAALMAGAAPSLVREGTDEWLALADEAIGCNAGEGFTPYWFADAMGAAPSLVRAASNGA